ncbi:MAG: hypothetical protein PHO66_03115 [Eubacteriales bacterium]|nr:hypothetical protein [Eubacteriales bacterium]
MPAFPERHLFAAANTPLGYYSHRGDALPGVRRLYWITGAPGTGKSTFIQKLAGTLAEGGQPVEYFHSPTAAQTLAGAVFPRMGTAVLEAHALDGCWVSAPLRTIDLNACVPVSALAAQPDDRIKLSAAYRRCHARACRYLEGVALLRRDAAAHVAAAAQPAAADREAVQMAYEEMAFYPAGQRRGVLRRLFATGPTPGGQISFLDSALQSCQRVYTLTGRPGSGAGALMAQVLETALARGLSVEAFYCPLDPQGPPEHLILPSVGAAVVTANAYHKPAAAPHAQIDMDAYVDSAALDESVLDFDTEQAGVLTHAALAALRKLTDLREEWAQLYQPHMEFDKADALCVEISREMLESAPPPAPPDEPPPITIRLNQ